MSYGYRIDLEDRNNLARNAKPLTRSFWKAYQAMQAPPEIDPRPWHKIEDQGSIGACQGHALSSVVEMCWHIAMGEVAQFSRRFAYLATQKIDGLLGQDSGSTIDGGRRCAMEYGVCLEEVLPYWNPPRYSPQIPKEAFEAAKQFKIKSHVMIKSYQDAFTFLAAGVGGVEIGIAWPDQWMALNSGARLEQFRPGSGGHAVCFLGYSTRKDQQGRNYLWMANSWNERWGDGGWAEVAPSCVDQMCRHQDTVMIGLSDLTTPEPRKFTWAGTMGT